MEKFFALIEKLKNLGIAAKLCGASNSTELCEEWDKFLSENSELVEEIKVWGAEFATNEASENIFKESAVIGDSKEVVIIICVCDDSRNVSECELCEFCSDLESSLRRTGENVAIAIAELSARGDMISEITAEEIFDYIQENLTDEDGSDGEEEIDGGEEEAECGEESDADEADSDETEADDGEDVAEEDSAKAADADPDYDA